MCSFSQGEFENFLRHIAAFRSDHQLGADVLLKLLALDQLLRTNKQDEGTLGRTEHTVDLVDTDVAVLGGLLGGEGQLEVNGNSFDLIVFHGFDSFHQSKNVDGLNRFFRGLVKTYTLLKSGFWKTLCAKGLRGVNCLRPIFFFGRMLPSAFGVLRRHIPHSIWLVRNRP